MRQSVSQLEEDDKQKTGGPEGQAGAGMLKSFEGNCAGCGQRVVFRVDVFGYCRCTNCGYQANSRLGGP